MFCYRTSNVKHRVCSKISTARGCRTVVGDRMCYCSFSIIGECEYKDTVSMITDSRTTLCVHCYSVSTITNSRTTLCVHCYNVSVITNGGTTLCAHCYSVSMITNGGTSLCAYCYSVSMITNGGTTLCAQCPERKLELRCNVAIYYFYLKKIFLM